MCDAEMSKIGERHPTEVNDRNSYGAKASLINVAEKSNDSA